MNPDILKGLQPIGSGKKPENDNLPQKPSVLRQKIAESIERLRATLRNRKPNTP